MVWRRVLVALAVAATLTGGTVATAPAETDTFAQSVFNAFPLIAQDQQMRLQADSHPVEAGHQGDSTAAVVSDLPDSYSMSNVDLRDENGNPLEQAPDLHTTDSVDGAMLAPEGAADYGYVTLPTAGSEPILRLGSGLFDTVAVRLHGRETVPAHVFDGGSAYQSVKPGIDEVVLASAGQVESWTIVRSGALTQQYDVDMPAGAELHSTNDGPSDGTPDPTFGTGGRVSFDLTGEAGLIANNLPVMAVAKAPDEKVVIAIASGGSVMAVGRLNSDGTFDTSFDGNGLKRVFETTLPFNSNSYYGDLTVDSAGRILVAGAADTTNIGGSNRTPVIARLATNGQLDTTFGGVGYVFPTGVQTGKYEGIDIDSQGRIVVAGTAEDTTAANVNMITRLGSDGTLDTAFGTQGTLVFTHPTETTAHATAVKVDASDRPIVSMSTGSTRMAIARASAAGVVDSSFGTSGYFGAVPPSVGGTPVTADLVAPNLGGGVAVTGYGNNPSRVFIARVTGSGAIDTTFDGDGFNQVPDLNQKRTARSIVELPGGKLAIAGDAAPTVTGATPSYFFVAAFYQ